jgi:hypothetical protein
LGVTVSEEQQRPARRETGRDTKTKLISAGLAVVGLALAGVGIIAIFTTQSDTGSAALLGFGAFLLLFAALGDRLESLRYGNLELGLRRKASDADRRGDFETSRILRNAADTLAGRAASAAERYKTIRKSMPSDLDRTRAMERLVAEARKDAGAPDLDQEEVLRMLGTGSEGARVWALGILQERPDLATPRAVLDAIERPDQMFDQYHALLLGTKFAAAPTTRTWTRERLARTVKAQLDAQAYGSDHDCINAAKALLQRVSDAEATPTGR